MKNGGHFHNYQRKENTDMKYKIELVTFKDINDFVKIAEKHDFKIKLTDGDDFCVNAKSLMGAMATVEWDNLYCESEKDIYSEISKYIID